MPTPHSTQSPMRYGAHYGLFAGAYFTAIFAMQVMMSMAPGVGLLGTIAIFAYPLVLYVQMRKTFVKNGYTNTYGDLFAQGVITTLCGALISCVASLMYIRLLQPDFVTDIVTQAIDTYTANGIPDDDPAVSQMSYMLKTSQLPSDAEMCTLMSSMIVMLGTICSAVCAAFAGRRPRKRAMS